MKPQDIIFLFVLAILIYKRKPEWFVWVGLACLVLAIPLFSFWIFYTAQRLIYYSFFLLLIAIIVYIFKKKNN